MILPLVLGMYCIVYSNFWLTGFSLGASYFLGGGFTKIVPLNKKFISGTE